MPVHGLAPNVGVLGGTAMELVATFALVYTVCAARDSRMGALQAAGPAVVGFSAGAGLLAISPLTGGSMNPARSFGPAMISGDFKNHGVYWVGPLLGGVLAVLVYDNLAVAPPAAATAAAPTVVSDAV